MGNKAEWLKDKVEVDGLTWQKVQGPNWQRWELVIEDFMIWLTDETQYDKPKYQEYFSTLPGGADSHGGFRLLVRYDNLGHGDVGAQIGTRYESADEAMRAAPPLALEAAKSSRDRLKEKLKIAQAAVDYLVKKQGE